MINDIHWDAIKEFYQREFGIDGWVVEMYANLDILSLCVSGASNSTIVEVLDVPMDEVIKVLSDTFQFDGWKRDLPINPLRMFNLFDGQKSSVEHYICFVGEVSIELRKQKELWEVNPVKLFYMCETFTDIEGKINDEWV